MAATASAKPLRPCEWPVNAIQPTTIAKRPVTIPNSGMPMRARIKAATATRFQRRPDRPLPDSADSSAAANERLGNGWAAANASRVIVNTAADPFACNFAADEHS